MEHCLLVNLMHQREKQTENKTIDGKMNEVIFLKIFNNHEKLQDFIIFFLSRVSTLLRLKNSELLFFKAGLNERA